MENTLKSEAALKKSSKAALKKLKSICRFEPQIGLVLGAGVTAGTREKKLVPLYPEMALYLCKLASEKQLVSDKSRLLFEFLKEKKASDLEQLQVTPEEIVFLLKRNLRNDLSCKQELLKLLKETLYHNDNSYIDIEEGAHKMVKPSEVYEENHTLRSIICFCARKSSKYRIETNPKVGGILTTNYDNLVEGSFGSKFGRSLLKPIARVTSREIYGDRRFIPVYHIHGYVSYVQSDDTEEKKASERLVIAQDDYFEEFYDPLGFSNYIAMNFLRRFRCLFIGSKMEDLQIRRLLFHWCKAMKGERARAEPLHFSIIKTTGDSVRDAFIDSVLLSYGVQTIWITDYEEIPDKLEEVYISAEGVESQDWMDLWEKRWWVRKK